MHREDRAYRQERAYREGSAHPGDPAYRQDGPYPDNPAYGQNGSYSDNPAYSQDGSYSGNAAYRQDGSYRQQSPYREANPYPEAGSYSEEGPYLGEGWYREDARYPGGQYAADSGYRSGEYAEDAGYLRNGHAADTVGYPHEGGYRQTPAYQENGRYEEDTYGDDTAQFGNGQYAGAPAYPQDDLYRRDGQYRTDAAFGGASLFGEDGSFPHDGQHREGGSYQGDGGHGEAGAFWQDGAHGEDRMYRQAEPTVSPRTSARQPGRRRATRRRGPRLVLRSVLAIVATLVLITGWSLGHALTVQGGGTVAERVAEWARSHGMGPLVTFGEWLTYKPPVKGGKPNVAFNKLGGQVVHKKKQYHGLTPIIPANIGSPAGKPLPGEGVWRAVESVKGVPAVFKTYVRESKTYSSYYAGIVSMDPRLLRFSLRPGTEDPGYGHWGAPMDIPAGHRLGLVATFNSGFRLYAAGGGFYLNGHYDGKLVNGAASEVYYRNGTMTVGTWGQGALHMGPDIAAVRQNLKLIVANGQVPASVNYNVETSWGATLGGGYYVWRSGVGVTKDGRIVYVYGPELDVRDLANLLKRAGCVSAMELDINPDWMSFMYYLAKNHPANPTPVNLLRNQLQPADRYYYLSNRDFTAVFSR